MKPLPFVNVMAFSSDSILLTGVLSEENGAFSISTTDKAIAYVQFSYIGYREHQERVLQDFSEENIDMGDIIMRIDEHMLDEVVVSAERPFIERRLDKLIINVENSIIDVGANTYEVLEKSPGISIDQDGAISLNGRPGVRILLDNKPARLLGLDLINFLQTLPSGSVQNIEIINNPSARYDAEGTAGIINIVRKRDAGHGTNGSIRLSYGRGIHHRSNGSFQLNKRSSKLNLHANVNGGYNEYSNNLLTHRRFSINDEIENTYDQDATLVRGIHGYSVTGGMDMYVSDKSTIGVLLTGNFNYFKPKGNGESLIFDRDEMFTGGFNSTNRSVVKRGNGAVNVMFEHKLAKEESQIRVNVDVAQYSSAADQHFTTSYFDKNHAFIGYEGLRGDISGDISLYAASIDFSYPILETVQFETGLRSSLVKNDNNLKYFDQVNDQEILDTDQSNHFLYDENINAVYFTLGKNAGKWNMQVGLRGEQTVADGNQLTTDTSFHRNYVQLFPSVFVNFTPSENHVFSLNIGRRINRPSYAQLNPFRGFVDVTTARDGNPFLRPESSVNINLGYTFNQRYSANLTLAQTKDNMINVLLQDDLERITIVTFVNIGTYNYAALNLSGTINPIEQWTCRMDGTVFYNQYKGIVSRTDLNNEDLSYNVSFSNGFAIGKGWRSELNFRYQPSLTYGISVMKARYNLDVGLQKQIWKNRGQVRFNVRDILWRSYPRGHTRFGNINEEFESIRDTRIATLSLSYRFGNQRVAPRQRRQTSAEDEMRRAT